MRAAAMANALIVLQKRQPMYMVVRPLFVRYVRNGILLNPLGGTD